MAIERAQRTTLVLFGIGTDWTSVPALRLGAWYIHRVVGSPGVAISHASGVTAVARLAPVQAVRTLRALARLPECPVADGIMHAMLANQTATPAVQAWLDQVETTIRIAAGMRRLGVRTIGG